MAKVSDLIREKTEAGQVFFSFEYFPPRTEQGVQNLYSRLDRMAQYGPLFVDFTWGAGGTTSDLTTELCVNTQKYVGLEVQMHLTCTNMPIQKFKDALNAAKDASIRNILALRGDPPRGEEWKAIEGGFGNAVDLVRYIRKEYGDYFSIAVAGYPEKHVDAPSYEQDLQFLKEKVDAGADVIITQLFYDVDLFIKFVHDCRNIGITVPILPGIMPVRSYAGLIRMCTLGGTAIPKQILEDLEPIKDDDRAVQDYGVKLGIEMCRKLLDSGLVNGLHFYTLNLERSTKEILLGLGLIKKEQLAKKYPWTNPRRGGKSLRPVPSQEDVRPIFWANRPKTYIARTEDWDEFPNGRWSDAGSPNFLSLGDYHYKSLYGSSAETRLKAYGTPTSVADIQETFANYLEGKTDRLPWNDTAVSPESALILAPLIHLNRNGYLTINSQPRVNAVDSSDKQVGWGPSGGFVYQKAYIEFFCSPETLDKFLGIISKFPSLSYQAVSLNGPSKATLKSVAAVTWGIWPDTQIRQPTVVDPEVFEKVWKDEAFSLWHSNWAKLYSEDSESYKLIEEIRTTYYLVNVIDNDFINGNIFAIFDELIGPAPAYSVVTKTINED